MLHKVLISPILTERSRALELENVYTFQVHSDATKADIKLAFETLYGQTPTNVRIAKNQPKYRQGRKGPMRKRGVIKKAYIQLQKPITNFAKLSAK